ncbi:endomucin isoform X2 [Engystomops pustulosus]|uniref:endomucin isoform X2 n=1 Tax=Engystomops pustulosus TaxID=76066 RepID=UPI003AFA981A
MKSIGADSLFLSFLILLTATHGNGEDGNQVMTVQSTTSGVLRTTSAVTSATPTDITAKTGNHSTLTPSPVLPTTKPSDVTKTTDAVTQTPTNNHTKNGTEATPKVSNTSDQYNPVNDSSTASSVTNRTTPSSTPATLNYTETEPTDVNTDDNSTAGRNNVLAYPEGSSDQTTSDQTGDIKPIPPRSKKGVIIGVVCVLASVVFVVLIFLYKMCQKKPQGKTMAEEENIKAAGDTVITKASHFVCTLHPPSPSVLSISHL